MAEDPLKRPLIVRVLLSLEATPLQASLVLLGPFSIWRLQLSLREAWVLVCFRRTAHGALAAKPQWFTKTNARSFFGPLAVYAESHQRRALSWKIEGKRFSATVIFITSVPEKTVSVGLVHWWPLPSQAWYRPLIYSSKKFRNN